MNTLNGNFIEKVVDPKKSTIKVNIQGKESDVPLSTVTDKGYKSYVALVTKDGTSSIPVSTVVYSDFPDNEFEWIYAAPGIYYLHSFNAVFTLNKIYCSTNSTPNSPIVPITEFGINPGDPTSYLTLKTYDSSFMPVDGWDGFIEIRVYN